MSDERIERIDSNCLSGWHDQTSQEYGVMHCITYGRVVSEGDEYLALAGSFESDAQVSDVMTIPKVCITKRVSLHVGDVIEP